MEGFIYKNLNETYYIVLHCTPLFYSQLAQAGMIATALYDQNQHFILLPEMQLEYAILDFKNLHWSKKVKKLFTQASYTFSCNTHFSRVIEHINAYHSPSWLLPEYVALLEQLHTMSLDNFKLLSFELYDASSKKLIAGEIGYCIGKTYTSLTGFSSKDKAYNNWGKLQLVLTALYLQKEHFDFWNLGHAFMPYKTQLGATIYPRSEFLKLWKRSTLKD